LLREHYSLRPPRRIHHEVREHIDPIFHPFNGDNPLAFVLAKNLHRRHLDESQRAMVATKLATLQNGHNQHSHEGAPIGAASQLEAAEMLNVSRRSVQRARDVVDHGAPELQQAVERGEVSVSAAAKIAKQPKNKQGEAIKQHKAKSSNPRTKKEAPGKRATSTTDRDFSSNREKLNHYLTAMLVHADSALDLSRMLHATYLDFPSAFTPEVAESVRRTAEAWSALAEILKETTDEAAITEPERHDQWAGWIGDIRHAMESIADDFAVHGFPKATHCKMPEQAIAIDVGNALVEIANRMTVIQQGLSAP
jgi:hypothetical protein